VIDRNYQIEYLGIMLQHDIAVGMELIRLNKGINEQA